MRIASILSIAYSLFHLLTTLVLLWLTLGWRVRRARKAFEKQLILQGMNKEDAKRISAQLAKMKKEMLGALRTGLK